MYQLIDSKIKQIIFLNLFISIFVLRDVIAEVGIYISKKSKVNISSFIYKQEWIIITQNRWSANLANFQCYYNKKHFKIYGLHNGQIKLIDNNVPDGKPIQIITNYLGSLEFEYKGIVEDDSFIPFTNKMFKMNDLTPINYTYIKNSNTPHIYLEFSEGNINNKSITAEGYLKKNYTEDDYEICFDKNGSYTVDGYIENFEWECINDNYVAQLFTFNVNQKDKYYGLSFQSGKYQININQKNIGVRQGKKTIHVITNHYQNPGNLKFNFQRKVNNAPKCYILNKDNFIFEDPNFEISKMTTNFEKYKRPSILLNIKQIIVPMEYGLLLHDSGEYDIYGNIEKWVPKDGFEDIWEGRLFTFFKVKDKKINKFEGIFFNKDKKRYQVNINNSLNDQQPGKALMVYMKSKVLPEKLNFFYKKQNNLEKFVKFNGNYFFFEDNKQKITNILINYIIEGPSILISLQDTKKKIVPPIMQSNQIRFNRIKDVYKNLVLEKKLYCMPFKIHLDTLKQIAAEEKITFNKIIDSLINSNWINKFEIRMVFDKDNFVSGRYLELITKNQLLNKTLSFKLGIPKKNKITYEQAVKNISILNKKNMLI